MYLNKVVYLQGRNNPTEIKTNKMKTLKRIEKLKFELQLNKDLGNKSIVELIKSQIKILENK